MQNLIYINSRGHPIGWLHSIVLIIVSLCMELFMQLVIVGCVLSLIIAFIYSLFENDNGRDKPLIQNTELELNELTDTKESKIKLNQGIDEDEFEEDLVDVFDDYRVKDKTIVYYTRYDGTFVFVHKKYAKDITRFVNALESANTWSEFKRKAPDWYDELVEHLNHWHDNLIDESEIKLKGKFSAIRELIMSEDESGYARLIPDLYDGMFEDIWTWLPEEIIKRYADYGDNPSGQSWMNIDNEEILDEIKALGYNLENFNDGNYNFGNFNR